MNERHGEESWTSCCPVSDTLSDLEIFGGFPIFATEMVEVGVKSSKVVNSYGASVFEIFSYVHHRLERKIFNLSR